MPEPEEEKKVSNNDLRNAQFGGGFINAENVNAQRIGGDILNFFFGQQTTTAVGNSARSKNERILLAAVKEEVTVRLRQSLHNAVLINLGKELQPQQVKRPWDAEIKIGLKPPEPLPNTTTPMQVFDSEEITGKLLILGAPGAGKTTTQLELAQELVKRAEEQPDYPIPVLFNLSSWKDDRQHLTDWIVAELKSKYGVSKKLGQDWVNNHKLLPLLDGLDELETQRQEGCVQAINEFFASETRPIYLVVCSRIEEYNSYSTQLQLNGAIYLQPLTNNQIYDYLTTNNYRELWSIISSNLDLLELIKTPLLLTILVLTSQEISVEEWQYRISTEDHLQYLLDVYIGRMLTREIKSKAYLKNKAPNVKQTRMWLVWLAKLMQRESKTEFLIEQMQPTLLKGKSIYFYIIITSLSITMLISGLIFGIIGCFLGISVGELKQISVVNFVVIWLLLGAIIGAFFFWPIFVLPEYMRASNENKIKIFETIKFSYGIFLVLIIYGLVAGGLMLWLGHLLGQNWIINGGLFTALIVMPLVALLTGFKEVEVENKTIPNQGIFKTAINTFKLSVLFFSPATVVIFLSIIIGYNSALFYSLTFGLLFGLFMGISISGRFVIAHFILRLTFYFNGYIPWNYACFLDYCTERLFLQRVGGRYRFIHKLLQDHFAQMEFRRISK